MTIVIFQREIVYIGSIKTHFLLGRKKRQIPIFFFFEQKDFFAQFVHSSDSLSSVWHTLKCYSVKGESIFLANAPVFVLLRTI